MTDNEWWGPDLTPPRGPDEDSLRWDSLEAFIAKFFRGYGKAMHSMLESLRPVTNALVEASRRTHDGGSAFDMPLSWTGQRYKKRKRPDVAGCHREYPTSGRPVYQPFIVKSNTRLHKTRYRYRR